MVSSHGLSWILPSQKSIFTLIKPVYLLFTPRVTYLINKPLKCQDNFPFPQNNKHTRAETTNPLIVIDIVLIVDC